MATKREIENNETSTKVLPGREKFAFLKGFNQITVKDAKEVQTEIMSALGLNSRVAWYNRLYGVVEPKITEYKSIEKIFAKHGVNDCWGV